MCQLVIVTGVLVIDGAGVVNGAGVDDGASGAEAALNDLRLLREWQFPQMKWINESLSMSFE